MRFAALLLSLVTLLVGFLLWRKVPRQHLFWIVNLSTWIYAFAFFLALRGVEMVAPQWTDGFAPYFPPIIPVGIFVAWALHRVRVLRGLE